MKTIVISGGSGGIGRTIVEYFVAQNWHVIAIDIDSRVLMDLATKTNNLEFVQADLTDHSSITHAVNQIQSRCNSVDALVNCAGTFAHFPLMEASQGQVEQFLSINVLAAHRLTNALFPLLYKVKGRIVNITSETAMASLPFQVYGLSKRMLESYSDMLRQELNLLGMKVILVRPGAHTTALLGKSRIELGGDHSNSLFENALQIIQNKGQKILDQGANDPNDVALIVFKAISSRNPKRIYHVNVSMRFRALSVLPRRIKEFTLNRLLSTYVK